LNIFQNVPENLFNLFISKNRAVYSYALIELFLAYERGPIFGLEKSIAQQILIDCLEKYELLTEEEEENHTSEREKANFILRRLEEYGWLYIDSDFNYTDWINFPEYSINLVQAFLKILNRTNSGALDDEYVDTNFKGYIFTIYMLLNSTDNVEYATVLDEVYRNTVLFLRELRKMDSRLKYYLGMIIEKSEVKDLISLLMNHKDEILDRAYVRLKTSDNINKYKHFIIKKLEEMQNDGFVMNMIVNDYMETKQMNYQDATMKADRQINEIIDTFKALEAMITEIDKKNKDYINSTITKIKFLMNTDNDIIGQINTILKFVRQEHKRSKTPRLNELDKLFNMTNSGFIDQESIFKPRGSYQHNLQNMLVTDFSDFDGLGEEFMKNYHNIYSENSIVTFVNEALELNPELKASDIIRTDFEHEEDIMKLLYIAAYSGLENYRVDINEDTVNHSRYKLKDFIIRKQEKHD